MNKENWTVYGYKAESAEPVLEKRAQYVSDVLDWVRRCIGAGADHVVVVKDNDDGK